jgi:hypothetical protein
MLEYSGMGVWMGKKVYGAMLASMNLLIELLVYKIFTLFSCQCKILRLSLTFDAYPGTVGPV